ncbi:dihydrofolate reductase family protein [Deinococcus koreensis]|uniref:Pyrimidine reductase n=1 Tax=Deinococcus koreensis TaxID=2054903 RepID=A0A2K3UWR0_9DEIO|nr:dihydrofolate reductase family protein [Deinococcus koreensis]PNY80972.1 pyrimidine reductase [Deinococcus koreensis]
MRRLIVTEFLTLDGVFENPAPPPGYPSPEIGQFKAEELFGSSALLLGRVTYQGFARYWPGMAGTSDFADRMNSLPKFVATSTPTPLEWNATALEGDVMAAVQALKQQAGGPLLTYGSGTLARTLLRHGLVDELRLMVYPLVLGRGRRFFSDDDRLTLRLTGTRNLGAGVVLLTYEPAAGG